MAMAKSQPICRLCLVEVDPELLSLINTNQHLIESILCITSLEVASNPNSLEYLCRKCQSELEQCIQFRTICIHNNDIFKEIVIEPTIDKYQSPDGILSEAIKVENFKVEIDDDEDQVVDSHAEVENGEVEEEIQKRSKKPKEPKEPGKRKKLKCKTDKDVPKSKDKYRKVQCQHCGAMVALHHLKGHLETHNPNRRKLTCPHCPKEFMCTKSRKMHINAIHTKEIVYTCDQCGNVYPWPHSLKDHILAAHTDEKRFECKQCGERFSRSALRNHHEKKVHSTARPYACEYCERTYKFKSDLTVHTRIHTGEKPFKCDICGKCFNKSYNVVIHKKSHRNDPT